MLVMLGAGIVVVFALAFGYYLLNGTLGDREQELADVQQQTAILETQVAALRQYEVLQSQRAQTESVVQGIYANRTLVSELLDGISLVVPENVWFQSVSLSTSDPIVIEPAAQATAGAVGDNKLAIEGNTYSFEDVAEVLVRLQLIPALSQVDLASAGVPRGATDPAADVKGFSIEAEVQNTQALDTPLPVTQVEVEGL